ncbi:MAG: hypothetical protein CYPHOPRED_005337 [Cyphobasidiales sp. Tagirdzhanova-0007]|nr:MAG: hypothetical protein CYPHOPRED_005337 [Cyphobasidiales sp. Tagirdzhanova-0007]
MATSSFVPEKKIEPGSYGMSESKEAAHDNDWSEVQNELGEADEIEDRVNKDDAAFSKSTQLAGTSGSKTTDKDKSLLQKGIDKIGDLSDQASKEYLAS